MEQDIREIKELLVMIYDEMKEVKIRVTNLERGFANLLERTTLLENKVEAMDKRISNLEVSMDEKFSSMDERISTLESSMGERISNLESSMDEKFSSMGERISTLESSMSEKVSNLESSMGERISNLESSTEKKTASLESRLADLEQSVKELKEFSRLKAAELHDQARRNFEILETDLGAAIDWSKFLQEQKVDKEALKKAAV